MFRIGIQRYEARIVDLQRPSYGPGDVQEGDLTNIVGVVKKDISDHKPLEPADDNSEPKDPKKPQV